MNQTTSKLINVKAIGALSAFLLMGGATAALATSAPGGPTATIAKKSNRLVGAYRGTTEVGGTVSFRVTKKGMVVGFTMPDVPVECRIHQQGNPPPYPKGTFTISAPPMKIRKGPEGGPQFLYEVPPDDSRAFQGIHVDGKGAPGGLKGNAVMISWNGPLTQSGTEECYTEFVDWNARKVGGKKK